MAYAKQAWGDGDPATPLSAARLSHIEDGVEHADAVADRENVWTATQIFDPEESIRIGNTLLLRLTDGFFGQRLHLTGVVQPGGGTPVMPYMEVAPAADTGEGTDSGGAIAGYQLYRTPGGGGVPDREFLAIEASGANSTMPGFKVATWASGTGTVMPLRFVIGSRETFRMLSTGEVQMGPNCFITADAGDPAPIRVRRQGIVTALRGQRSDSTVDGPRTHLIKSRGSIAAPTPPISGDQLGAYRAGSVTTDGATELTGGDLSFFATENWVASPAAQGARAEIRTATPGTATIARQAGFEEPVAASETALLLRVNKSGTKTWVRVEIGTADSGGAGKRALVIPN